MKTLAPPLHQARPRDGPACGAITFQGSLHTLALQGKRPTVRLTTKPCVGQSARRRVLLAQVPTSVLHQLRPPRRAKGTAARRIRPNTRAETGPPPRLRPLGDTGVAVAGGATTVTDLPALDPPDPAVKTAKLRSRGPGHSVR